MFAAAVTAGVTASARVPAAEILSAAKAFRRMPTPSQMEAPQILPAAQALRPVPTAKQMETA